MPRRAPTNVAVFIADWNTSRRPDTSARPAWHRPTLERFRAAEDAQVPAEAVHARLASSRVIPRALAVPCLTHAVQAGTPRFRGIRGVCADRLRRGRWPS